MCSLFKKKRTYAMLTMMLLVASCGAPDKRTYEDGWNVIRNQCDDVSSTIRIKEQYQLSASRELTLHDQQNRNIYALKIKATRAGVTMQSITFANDLSNRELETKAIKSSDLNDEANAAIDKYYDQPGKHKELRFNCLFRGLRSS